jgi:hypothetical protein
MMFAVALILFASIIQCEPVNVAEMLGAVNPNLKINAKNASSAGFVTMVPTATGTSCSGSGCIGYNMGAHVLTGAVNIYYIYYGTFTSAQKAIFQNFGNNVGSSSWYNINRSM